MGDSDFNISDPSSYINGLVNFFEKYWFKLSGLLAFLIFIFISEFLVSAYFKISFKPFSLFSLSSLLLISLIWFFTRRYPRNPKGKVGFLVSISCQNDEEGSSVSQDFIDPLRRLIKSGNTGKYFKFIVLPKHLTSKINDNEDAEYARLKTRSHFMLYGNVRLRKIGGQDHHVIELEGIVSLRPVPNEINSQFSQEFAELLPRRLHISTENDLLSFQFTSEWASVVARYIIGIAAFYSGDLISSESFFKDALDQLKGKDKSFPIFDRLSKRIPIRLSEIYEIKACAMERNWRKTHDPENMAQIGEFLKNIDSSRENLQHISILRAIYYFLYEKNSGKSIEILKKSGSKDAVWFLNMAFLHCYKGDFRPAKSYYEKASKFEIKEETLIEIDDFINWILEKEPEKPNLYYCRGYFNWKIKGNLFQAKIDFAKFLELSAGGRNTKAIELVRQWLSGVEKEIESIFNGSEESSP